MFETCLDRFSYSSLFKVVTYCWFFATNYCEVLPLTGPPGFEGLRESSAKGALPLYGSP